MLSEIKCDLFREGDEPRGVIGFKEGLNLIVGGDTAANSIGKTTFLLAIDFALGGSTYAEGPGDMFDNIDHHEICFAHKFGETKYYFKRHTSEPNIVWKCDPSYNPLSSISKDEYTEWLAANYGLSELGNTFRDLQAPFFRIYGTNRDDVDRPLRAHSSDSMGKDLLRLIKLFNKYGKISRIEEESDELSKDKKAYRDAKSRKFIRPADGREEYKANERRIASLEAQMGRILAGCETGTEDIDSSKEEYASQLKSTLRTYRRKRTLAQVRLDEIRQDLELISFTQAKDFSDLERFFPNVNLEEIGQIEEFHKGITKILKENHREEISDAQKELDYLDMQIGDIERSLSELGATTNLPAVVVEQYADLKSMVEELKKANELYDQNLEFNRKSKELNEKRDAEWDVQLREIQPELNEEMKSLNSDATNPMITSPEIDLISPNRYRFSVPNDGGTGSRYRGLFIFDIAMLHLTPLEFAIHDSPGIKQIEDDHIIGILNLYNGMEKQVFAAIDKVESYSEKGEVPSVIKENTVLHLMKGKELFGWAWNLETDEEESDGDSDNE